MTEPKHFSAVVWDMDGLLLDTERLSFIAWEHGANVLGYQLGHELFVRLIGMNSKRIKESLLEWLGPGVDVETLTQHAGEHYDTLIANGPPLKPGAVACLETLTRLGIPQALATSSSRRYAEKKLGHHGLLDHFQTLVTGDQVSQGKPHPEPYLTAAARLDLPPAACIAFEDSVNGIRSAHEAGMFTALVPDMAPHDSESLARVRIQFSSLEEAVPFLEKSFG